MTLRLKVILAALCAVLLTPRKSSPSESRRLPRVLSTPWICRLRSAIWCSTDKRGAPVWPLLQAVATRVAGPNSDIIEDDEKQKGKGLRMAIWPKSAEGHETTGVKVQGIRT